MHYTLIMHFTCSIELSCAEYRALPGAHAYSDLFCSLISCRYKNDANKNILVNTFPQGTIHWLLRILIHRPTGQFYTLDGATAPKDLQFFNVAIRNTRCYPEHSDAPVDLIKDWLVHQESYHGRTAIAPTRSQDFQTPTCFMLGLTARGVFFHVCLLQIAVRWSAIFLAFARR